MHDVPALAAQKWMRCFSAASFWSPHFMNGSEWTVHGPFGFWLVDALRPNRIVELAEQAGFPYFVFCQSVRTLQSPTECLAINHHEERKQIGNKEYDILPKPKLYNQMHYLDFSQILDIGSSEAVFSIEDQLIDLLHIDSRHGYQAVRNEFEAWLPKISDRGVIVFHPTNDQGQASGIARLWEEVRQAYPSFEFLHGNGLGVLGVGESQAPALRALFEIAGHDVSARDLIRLGYARLGAGIADHARAAVAQAELEKRRHAETELAHAQGTAKAMQASLETLVANQAHVRFLGTTIDKLSPVASSLGVVADRLGKTSKKVSKLGRAATRRVARRPTLFGRLVQRNPRRRKRAPARHPTPVAETPAKQEATAPPPAKPRTASTSREGFVEAAIQVVLKEGWRASTPFWKAVYEQKVSISRPDLYEIQRVVATDFDEVVPRQTARGNKLRWCIYTTLFGGYDDLRAPIDPPEGIDFICFSDSDVTVDGWRTIRVGGVNGPVLDSRQYKILPHRFLAEYDASLYIDANTLLTGDIGSFVRRWCIGNPLVMWRHSHRCDVYDEAIAVLTQFKTDPERVIEQISSYESAGLPRATGLVEASFIWREHNGENVTRLMDAWDEEFRNGSARDQISLGFLMWSLGTRPKVLPTRLGNVRANCVSSLVPHYSRAEKRMFVVPRAIRPAAGRTRRVVILYDDKYRTSGTTTMRAFQLAEIIRTRLGEEFEVTVTSDIEIRGAIVVLTKGRLARITEYEAQRLARHNIAVVADFVDDPTRTSLLEFVDLIWAASIGAYRAALFSKPLIDVDMITHHVDLRIPKQQPTPHFSVGYLGETVNAVLSPEIMQSVTIIPINTQIDDVEWLKDVSRFALHYAVRQKRRGSGHKPFLKGFVAAQCAANILIDRSDGDAIYYLGDDYPFLINDNQTATILTGIEFARQSFGGEVWLQATERMKHIETLCSPERIAREVRRSLRRFN